MVILLGQTIKSLREKQGYSLDEFAHIVGVTKQTLIKWEHGVSIPRIKHVVKICDTFNISIHFFLNLCKENNKA